MLAAPHNFYKLFESLDLVSEGRSEVQVSQGESLGIRYNNNHRFLFINTGTKKEPEHHNERVQV